MRIARFLCSLLLAVGSLAIPAQSRAQVAVGIVVQIGPPELPIYEQPLCPGDGYIWVPGYWAWDGDGDDYYWVPGTWVLVPEVGFFWTPGYWAWGGSGFIFYEGYWGPVVGFYGGINYGYGYFGHGYEGGRWDNGRFYYNRSVNNVNITEIHNVYNTTVVNNTTVTRVSYNGGNGGINERPTPQEQAAAREKHISPVPAQVQHVQAARANPALRASANRGKPPVAATPKPGALNDRAIVPAKEGGRYNPPAARSQTNANAARPSTAIHPNELPAITHPTAPSTANPNVDRKYQQEQEKLNARQEQERQKLQQKQEQEHQRLAQQKAGEARKQQLEQQHQQQTQQLAQKHTQEQQKLQERQQPPRQNPPKPPPKEKP
jgi:YXWGXW repeat-containing protein